MPELTAITASAALTAVRSTHDEIRYPPPSCSAFHGRNGSSEWAVSTCGTSCSSDARCPAIPAYQVCECTTSASAAALAITSSADSVDSAGLAPRSCGVRLMDERVGRGAPMQCTST